MVDRGKLSCGFGTTFGVTNSVEVVDVGEETGTFLALGCLLCLLKEIARTLLSHDHIHTFERGIWCNILPDISNAT